MIPKDKIYKLLVIVVVLTILFYVLDKQNTHRLYQSVSFEDEFDIQIKSSFNNRGTLFLNEGEIKLYGHYPISNYDELQNKIVEFDESSGRLWGKSNNYLPVMKDIRPPYRLIKKANCDTLKFIKMPDTILVVIKTGNDRG